jgi:ABC-type transporter Mla subunit MlaD
VKRKNEFLVGISVLVALALVVAGALWLSETTVGGDRTLLTARFRTVEGLNVGAPVTVRGVRVGKVAAVRLASDGWVETDLQLTTEIALPARPAVIASAASLFGEWSAEITSLEPLPEDPIMRAQLLSAAAAGGDALPGATLPDIGQLTAQASRIATDIAGLTDRIESTFDSAAIRDMRRSILALAAVTDRLARFAEGQTGRLAAACRPRWRASTPRRAAGRSARWSTTARRPAPTCGRPRPTCAR